MTETTTAERDEAPEAPEAPPPAPAPQKRSEVYEASKALAVRDDGRAQVPMPTTFAQMQDFAAAMAGAGPMVGGAFRGRMGACLGILTQAMRWGMDPYAVSHKAYIAAKDEEIEQGKGAIAYEGQLVLAVIQQNAPLQRRLRYTFAGEGMDMTCTVTGWLTGEDEPFVYTSPPAKKLKRKSPLWDTDTAQQLVYYSGRAWARRYVPEIILGVYTPEEIEEAREPSQGRSDGEIITLSGGAVSASQEPDAPVQDAEFTDVGKVIERQAAKKQASKPAKAEAAKPAKAPAKTKAAAGGETGDRPASGGDATARAEGTDREQSATTPADADSQSGADADEDLPTDAQILDSVDAEEAALKGPRKGDAIKANVGALRRIAETGDAADAKRARALIDRYEME